MREPQTMREVLLALALTSAAAAAKMDADSGGGSARHYEHVVLAGTLGDDEDGAPHLYYAELYARARDDKGRAEVFAAAKKALDAIRRSKGDPTKTETREELYARIVEHGAGWPRLEVARWARTSEAVVATARRLAGRDEEFGHPTRDLTKLPADERRAWVREREQQGLNGKAISRLSGIPYITVRRDLGRS